MMCCTVSCRESVDVSSIGTLMILRVPLSVSGYPPSVRSVRTGLVCYGADVSHREVILASLPATCIRNESLPMRLHTTP